MASRTESPIYKYSLWVKCPWYGGMKSTLLKMATWEQKTALQYTRELMLAKMN